MTFPLVGPLLDNKILILILILYMLLFWEFTNKICVFIYVFIFWEITNKICLLICFYILGNHK